MKILSWMQSKLTGKPQNKKPNLQLFDYEHIAQKPSKEDEPISEWPHGLLTIGTLGTNHQSKDVVLHAPAAPPPSPRDDFTPEELDSFFNEHYVNHSTSSAAELDKFLNSQSSFKLNEITRSNAADTKDPPKEHCSSRFQRSTSAIYSRGKGANSTESTNNVIAKSSLSFLLKKMHVCRSGFTAPVVAPGLINQLPKSKMEKLLRAILGNKIYPQQRSKSTLLKKACSQDRHMNKANVTSNGDKLAEKVDDSDSDDEDGNKWDKSESEYIVLEI